MNKNFSLLLFVIAFIFQLTFSSNVIAAQDLTDLVEQGKLKISLQVNQKNQQIVGQALIIAIEVSTQRWFAGGSQLQHFSLKDVVMQANNIMTINGSKRINGQTWVTQLHEITVYPTKSGSYPIEPIKVDVSVNTESDGVVSGTLTTLPSSFNIQLPEALIGIDSFIVSPKVTLSIEGHFDEEKDYAVGEAITQTITITASDTPAMMIPPINMITNQQSANGSSAAAGISGLSIYHKPATVVDKSNRGMLTGTRKESFTYIFEKPGSYLIDEQVIYWWNSQTASLERLIIPASAWTVSGGGFSQVTQQVNFNGLSLSLESIISLLIGLLLLIFSYFAWIKRHQIVVVYCKITKREQRKLRSSFLKAVTEKDYLAATQYIYQYKLLAKEKSPDLDCSLTATLNELAFNDGVMDKNALSFSVTQAKALINKIDTSATNKEKAANFIPNERINLNNK